MGIANRATVRAMVAAAARERGGAERGPPSWGRRGSSGTAGGYRIVAGLAWARDAIDAQAPRPRPARKLPTTGRRVIASDVPFTKLPNLASWRPFAPIAVACALSLSGCPGPGAEGGSNGNGSGDSTGAAPAETDTGDDGPKVICVPGRTRCDGDATIEVCAPTGLKWTPSPCSLYEECDPCFDELQGDCVAVCVGPCERLGELPSSEGCSFYATSMYQAGQVVADLEDAIVVGNPQPELPATVELYFTPFGSNVEVLVEGPIELMPGSSHVFDLSADLTDYIESTSLYRSGAVHHVVSDLPVVAYLHSPFQGDSTNGSSLLLPEHVMTGDYVVYGHAAYNNPSYFIVIALEDQTTVRWWPTADTAGDYLPLPFVEAGGMGSQLLNRFDNIRVDSSVKNAPPICDRDLSGTVIEADKPIWVVSAVRAARIPLCRHTTVVEGCESFVEPLCASGSDFLQEQNLPLDYWGREYVGPHSPLRGSEDHYWRVYAGDDNVTVTVDPPQPGTPIQLAKRGDWQELVAPAGTNLLFNGTGPFMPVQYVAGHYVANNIGSPAMVQMVPTAQFLNSYVFVTGYGYEYHYVQTVRPSGGADVLLDDELVTGWQEFGAWEVATIDIEEGPHEIESADSFGIIQYGYSVLPDPNNPTSKPSSGYAYPGGMKAEIIFIP